jgi:hypothetical protein
MNSGATTTLDCWISFATVCVVPSPCTRVLFLLYDARLTSSATSSGSRLVGSYHFRAKQDAARTLAGRSAAMYREKLDATLQARPKMHINIIGADTLRSALAFTRLPKQTIEAIITSRPFASIDDLRERVSSVLTAVAYSPLGPRMARELSLQLVFEHSTKDCGCEACIVRDLVVALSPLKRRLPESEDGDANSSRTQQRARQL